MQSTSSEIEGPIEELEQYATPASIAASIAWNSRHTLKGGIILDLGCGTGRLMVASLLAGASYSVGVELDARLARECLRALERSCTWATADVVRADVAHLPIRNIGALVVMNPPFGTRRRGADRVFLEAAFRIAVMVFAVHYDDEGVRRYLSRLSSRKGFRLLGTTRYKMMLRQTMVHHRSRRKYLPVAVYVFQKQFLEERWEPGDKGGSNGGQEQE